MIEGSEPALLLCVQKIHPVYLIRRGDLHWKRPWWTMKHDGSFTRRRFFEAAGIVGLGLGLGSASARGTRVVGTAKKPIRSCILIFDYGGPSHLDTLDVKPDAPAEVRGEYRAIPTSVPGLQV